jgi:ABC-2 type transport system ATP-binding protein
MSDRSQKHEIIVEDVKKSYGDVQALKGVSVTARPGQILGLLGPNGAGKTTLVRILTTLLQPDSGHAEVAGIDVFKDPGGVRSVIGLAGQYPAVDELLTGRENLVMVGELYQMRRREAKNRANELLKQFTLEDAADRTIKTYSGGMRRRLDLAASIVARPRVLILDEPTTGLDPRTRRDMWSVIRELVSDGTTLLLTTQYLEEADVLAEDIVVFDKGEVIAEGTPDELKSKLGADILQIRVDNDGDIARVKSMLAFVSDEEPQVDEDSGWVRISVDEGTNSLIKAVRKLDEENISVADISIRRPTLDEVFLAITAV